MKSKNRTQIIATIGPASKDSETIKEMIIAGVDVARLNFSWGTHEEHADFVEKIRKCASEIGKHVSVMADLSGPRLSTESGHSFDDNSEIITDKDKVDLRFALGLKVEYIAMSYVGSHEDIEQMKNLIKEIGGSAKVIAKIERPEAVEDIEHITESADAIMIARGDLGNNIPFEKVPFVESDIIKVANSKNKPVIVATEMMSSMIDRDVPSRADVTDVAYAIIENADAVMLSNETAIGKNPVKVIEVMEKIITESEKHDKDVNINQL